MPNIFLYFNYSLILLINFYYYFIFILFKIYINLFNFFSLL